MIRTIKIRACYKCKEYVVIFDANHSSINREKIFLNFHPGHPTQIVRGPEAEALIKKGYSEFKVGYGDLD